MLKLQATSPVNPIRRACTQTNRRQSDCQQRRVSDAKVSQSAQCLAFISYHLDFVVCEVADVGVVNPGSLATVGPPETLAVERGAPNRDVGVNNASLRQPAICMCPTLISNDSLLLKSILPAQSAPASVAHMPRWIGSAVEHVN